MKSASDVTRALRRAVCLVGAAVLCAPTSAGGAAGDPLLPDLLPQPLQREVTIGLYSHGDRTILDVGFTAANVGAGPLELAPLPEPEADDPAADCDNDGDAANDRPERQNVYVDVDGDGAFDPEVDTARQSRGDGCSVYHPGHSHWHAATLATDLIAQPGVTPVRALDKPTYCLIDAGIFDEGLTGFRDGQVYEPAGCSEDTPQGVSVGWFDRYSVGLTGQQIDVTGLPAGTYCVRQSFDPSDSIDEVREDNNTVLTPIGMDPAEEQLEVLGGDCAAPWQVIVDSSSPNTTLLNQPRQRLKTRRRFATVQFGFVADDSSAEVRCSVDGEVFRSCASPTQIRFRARRGRWIEHTFAVGAADDRGNIDLSPATWTGRVKRRG